MRYKEIKLSDNSGQDAPVRFCAENQGLIIVGLIKQNLPREVTTVALNYFKEVQSDNSLYKWFGIHD